MSCFIFQHKILSSSVGMLHTGPLFGFVTKCSYGNNLKYTSVSNLHSADSSLTIERVSPVFVSMTDWAVLKNHVGRCDVIPDSRAENIRSQYPSDNDQRKQAAIYYVNVDPAASWESLARFLYMYQEVAALKAFKEYLPKIIGNQNYYAVRACGIWFAYMCTKFISYLRLRIGLSLFSTHNVLATQL